MILHITPVGKVQLGQQGPLWLQAALWGRDVIVFSQLSLAYA